jgi:hypothetical protein
VAEPLRWDVPVQANHAELYNLLVSELTDFVVFLFAVFLMKRRAASQAGIRALNAT